MFITFFFSKFKVIMSHCDRTNMAVWATYTSFASSILPPQIQISHIPKLILPFSQVLSAPDTKVILLQWSYHKQKRGQVQGSIWARGPASKWGGNKQARGPVSGRAGTCMAAAAAAEQQGPNKGASKWVGRWAGIHAAPGAVPAAVPTMAMGAVVAEAGAAAAEAAGAAVDTPLTLPSPPLPLSFPSPLII